MCKAVDPGDLCQSWRSLLDSAAQGKPIFIRHGDDTLMLASTATLAQLAEPVRLTAAAYTESNGSVTLSLDALDLVVNAGDLAQAKVEMARELIGYAQDYYRDFARYSKAPNRRAHLPYVIRALLAETPADLVRIIDIRVCTP